VQELGGRTRLSRSVRSEWKHEKTIGYLSKDEICFHRCNGEKIHADCERVTMQECSKKFPSASGDVVPAINDYVRAFVVM
jgi:hypothetical protein